MVVSIACDAFPRADISELAMLVYMHICGQILACNFSKNHFHSRLIRQQAVVESAEGGVHSEDKIG